MPIEDDERIREILEQSKTIAVVGASVKPWRDSNSIADFLDAEGYRVIPVNPKYTEVLGIQCYPNLKAIPDPIDIVDIFRNSEAVPEIVEQAIDIKAKTIWMQLGVLNEKAAKQAEDAGLNVVMDKCILVEHKRLL